MTPPLARGQTELVIATLRVLLEVIRLLQSTAPRCDASPMTLRSEGL